MAAPVREDERSVITLAAYRGRNLLRELKAAALEQKPHLDIDICDTDDGTPYLSVDLPGWANIMVTPEPRHPGKYGVVISDEEGHYIKIAKAVTLARALFKIINYS